ncbi:hypothetical protein GCM10007205_10600 [Oxalicibacterium flavum]|uniref:Transmembrane protein n=1 Tax=Oxalicibacterium flavum TaxID=179467 RepID=A0A8J2UM22_9BURK|nr:hypothetical protein [Oxalicibacterium flavum]GGC03259.1 hypothetical protein GCM10007205_10600 [Oxalicibacterium flavum]
MYIVVIAWLYVVFMMSITETSPVAGIMTFVFYGLLPTGIMVWLAGTGKRRQKRKARDAAAREAANTAKERSE